MPPRKNKRGARGSTDEEPNTAKRLNMASDTEKNEGTNEQDDNEQDDEEPSLLEIKTLLINIQTSITNITKENQALRKEVSDLKDSLEFSDTELKKVKDSLEKAIVTNTALQKKLDKANNELRKNAEKLTDQKYETDRLEDALDNLEQYTRKNSLEIHGIPDNLYSNPEEVIHKVAEAINVSIEPSDIEICHKLKRDKGVPPIIVKFISHKIKSKLYRERTKLKRVKVSDIFPSYSLTPEARIFIHENLTSYRKSVVAEASKRRRNGTIHNIWTLDGKIYVKTSPDGNPIRIFCVEDLDDI